MRPQTVQLKAVTFKQIRPTGHQTIGPSVFKFHLYVALFACAHECLLSSLQTLIVSDKKTSRRRGGGSIHCLEYFPWKLVQLILLSERLQQVHHHHQVSLSRLMAMNTAALNPQQVGAAGVAEAAPVEQRKITLTGSSSNGTGRIHGVYHSLVHSWFHLKQTQLLHRPREWT